MVRQWMHARVSQGCCGLAGFACYDAPHAVLFGCGRCKAGFASAVFPLVSTGPSFWVHGVMDLKDIPWRSHRCISRISLTCPLYSEYVQCCLCADRGDSTGAVLGCVIDMPVVVHVKVVDITSWRRGCFPWSSGQT